ncbi:MAG: hypothetical protein GF308_15220 [Candidatus Heimdallarchaeota archaeon]|nr:hypothetical protein [Candidatus Heimdallarchaeota archaeon]
MKRRNNILKRLVKNQEGVSQTLAAIMMIILVTSSIAVVWGWLFPAYQRFQTINTINNVNSYMLRLDESVYFLLDEGEETMRVLNLDAFTGEYRYEEGETPAIRFRDGAETINATFTSDDSLGRFAYNYYGRGAMISQGGEKYLKGPVAQPVFFINDTLEGSYNGLTRLLLTRPLDRTMKISLDYRVQLYSWFDTSNNQLNIRLNLILLEVNGNEISFTNYNRMKLFYNRTETLDTRSWSLNSRFFVEGTLSPNNFSPKDSALTFEHPTPGTTYSVSIEIIGNYFTISRA